jgi:hypothetical protein
VFSFFSDFFGPKVCEHFSPLSCMLHVSPIPLTCHSNNLQWRFIRNPPRNRCVKGTAELASGILLSFRHYRALCAGAVRGCIQKFPDWVDNEISNNTRWEATQSVMAAKLTRLTHKMEIQLHPVAESCTICSSRSRRPVWKLLDTPSYCIGTYCV